MVLLILTRPFRLSEGTFDGAQTDILQDGFSNLGVKLPTEEFPALSGGEEEGGEFGAIEAGERI